MPTEPLQTRIKNNILAALRAIRKANDYWFDVYDENVSEVMKTPDQILEGVMPYCDVVLDDQINEFLFMPKRDRATLDVLIRAFVRSDDQSVQYRDRERWIQDIQKSLQVDTTRGQLARMTRTREIEREDGDAAYDRISAARLRIEVVFDFDWTSP